MTVAKDNFSRLDILKLWQREGGVLIISYDVFRRLCAKKIPKLGKTNRDKMEELLIDPGADIVICDEGHVLKNLKSAISVACSNISTKRRIVLTGTPLQNNLEEYHCMLSFVKPHLLGTPKEFRNRFVNPIMNGQYDDSNEYDVKRMKKRIHILHKLLDGCVQRCDYSALTKFLPPKYEYVISVKLSEVQVKMYQWYLDNLSRSKGEEKFRGGTLFQDYNALRNLCSHPFIVQTRFVQRQKRQELIDDGSDMEDFIDDDDVTSQSNASSSSERDVVVREYKTRSQVEDGSKIDKSEIEDDPSKEWFHQFISDEDSCNPMLSGKMVLLAEILKECETVGDKVVLFSQSLMTLNCIEDILEYLDEQPVSEEDKKRDIMRRWVKNVDYFRMDGTTSADFRKSFIDRFNSVENARARLFLVSTKAGGLGTNLVGANRVIVMDASWNPSHDVQAIFRVYRFGQTKPVYIYRLLSQGTMEEKIYNRQVTKLSLSIRVVDEQQIDRHFNSAELAELYKFEPDVQKECPTPMLPKDTLLAEMLIKQSDWIVTYHEHDSLLETKTEEDLTEGERQAAWTEYENEREEYAIGHFSIHENKSEEEHQAVWNGYENKRERRAIGHSSINENKTEGGHRAAWNGYENKREGHAIGYFCVDDAIALYLKEPDFNLDNYDGSMIPTCKQILEDFRKTLNEKFPLSTAPDFRKRLLVMVHTLKVAFQEKHVKILRIQQDYVARGSVPSVVNKYLGELNIILTDMCQQFQSISEVIKNDARAAHQARILNLAAYYGAGSNFNQHSIRMPTYGAMPGFRPPGSYSSTPQEAHLHTSTTSAGAAIHSTVASMIKRMNSDLKNGTSSQPVIIKVIQDKNTSTMTLRKRKSRPSYVT